MNMPTTSIKARIPSLRIDANFLQDLAQTVEEEIRQNCVRAKETLEKKIAEKEKKIHQDEHWKDSEKESEIREMRSRETEYAYRYVGRVSYEFEGRDGESVTFRSSSDFGDWSLIPLDVESCTVRVTHTNKDCVDVSLRFEEVFGLGRAELNSENGNALRGLQSKLLRLFAKYRGGYHSFLLWGPNPIFVRGTVGGISATCVLILIASWLLANVSASSDRYKAIVFAAAALLVPLTMGFAKILKYLYPVYEFEIGTRDMPRKQFRSFFWIVFGGVVVGVIGNAVFQHLPL